MKNVYDITNEFEEKLARYTGAKYAVTLDNMSNGLFLALYYEHYVNKSIKTDTITIPNRTYPSVPCEIIHAGLKVGWDIQEGNTITGAYELKGSNVWDSALTLPLICTNPELICVFHLLDLISILNYLKVVLF